METTNKKEFILSETWKAEVNQMTDEELRDLWWEDAKWFMERNIHYSSEYPAMCARTQFIEGLIKQRGIDKLKLAYRQELTNVMRGKSINKL